MNKVNSNKCLICLVGKKYSITKETIWHALSGVSPKIKKHTATDFKCKQGHTHMENWGQIPAVTQLLLHWRIQVIKGTESSGRGAIGHILSYAQYILKELQSVATFSLIACTFILTPRLQLRPSGRRSYHDISTFSTDLNE